MPTAVATATPNPAAPGQTIDFDASGSWHDRPDRSIVQYEWDFHYDGSFNPEASSATPSAGFTYDAFGVYNVMLRVTDDNSPAKRDFLDEPLVITVDQGNQAPTADAGGPYVVEAGSGIVLDGSGSSIPARPSATRSPVTSGRLTATSCRSTRRRSASPGGSTGRDGAARGQRNRSR